MSSTYTSQRSWRTGVRIMMFGMVSIGVDICPVAPSKTKETEFKQLCPDEHDGRGPSPIRQLLQCQMDEEHVLERHQTVRGRQTEPDGPWVVASDEEITEAKVGSETPEKLLALTPHPAGEVLGATFPVGKGYRLRPGRTGKVVSEADEALYASIRDAVTAVADETVFVGALRIGKSQGIYRLDVWDGQLVAVEITTDSDLYERDVIDPNVDTGQFTDMVRTLTAQHTVAWDEDRYRHDAATAVAELLAAKADGAPALEAKAPVAADGGMDAMLAAMASLIEAGDSATAA